MKPLRISLHWFASSKYALDAAASALLAASMRGFHFLSSFAHSMAYALLIALHFSKAASTLALALFCLADSF